MRTIEQQRECPQHRVKASNARTALRTALKGAKPLSAEVVVPAGRGAYDFSHSASVVVTWDNGWQTLHEDRFCGQDQLRGGMYREHVTLLDAYIMRDYVEESVRIELAVLGPREQKRFEAAVAMAPQIA